VVAVRGARAEMTSELILAAVPLKSRLSWPSTNEMGNSISRYCPAGLSVAWTFAMDSAVMAMLVASVASPAMSLTV
jgi:hypothetical protein